MNKQHNTTRLLNRFHRESLNLFR